jgi:hypothetical protein
MTQNPVWQDLTKGGDGRLLVNGECLSYSSFLGWFLVEFSWSKLWWNGTIGGPKAFLFLAPDRIQS